MPAVMAAAKLRPKGQDPDGRLCRLPVGVHALSYIQMDYFFQSTGTKSYYMFVFEPRIS